MSALRSLLCILLGHEYNCVELMLGKLEPKKVKVKRCERCRRVLVPTQKNESLD